MSVPYGLNRCKEVLGTCNYATLAAIDPSRTYYGLHALDISSLFTCLVKFPRVKIFRCR